MGKRGGSGERPNKPAQRQALKLGAADYWVVVRRARPNVKTLLEITFAGRDRFTVIEDRRVATHALRRAKDRRRNVETVRLEDFFLAERQDL